MGRAGRGVAGTAVPYARALGTPAARRPAGFALGVASDRAGNDAAAAARHRSAGQLAPLRPRPLRCFRPGPRAASRAEQQSHREAAGAAHRPAEGGGAAGPSAEDPPDGGQEAPRRGVSGCVVDGRASRRDAAARTARSRDASRRRTRAGGRRQAFACPRSRAPRAPDQRERRLEAGLRLRRLRVALRVAAASTQTVRWRDSPLPSCPERVM